MRAIFATALGLSCILVSPGVIAEDFGWAGKFGGGHADWAFGVALDDSGNVYTVGQFRGTADFDPGPEMYELTTNGGSDSPFICKLGASGNFVWAAQIAGTGTGSARDVALGADGSVYTVGYFVGTAESPAVGC